MNSVRKAHMEQIGRAIKQRRRRADLSMRELAERCEIHLTAVHLIENAKREPRVGLLIKIAQGLGCTLDDLVDVTII